MSTGANTIDVSRSVGDERDRRALRDERPRRQMAGSGGARFELAQPPIQNARLARCRAAYPAGARPRPREPHVDGPKGNAPSSAIHAEIRDRRTREPQRPPDRRARLRVAPPMKSRAAGSTSAISLVTAAGAPPGTRREGIRDRDDDLAGDQGTSPAGRPRVPRARDRARATTPPGATAVTMTRRAAAAFEVALLDRGLRGPRRR